MVLSYDTTLAQSSDRIRAWVNGEEITSWNTETQPSQNREGRINDSKQHVAMYAPETGGA